MTPSFTTLKLMAPIDGIMMDITQVPDPVFAQKLVGDGFSIDPLSNVLVSPAAGKVIQLHSALHAITIQTIEGVDVLIHIGLETVTLKGQGFKALISEGQEVNVGTPLIEFDMDYVAKHSKSLLTQVVITNDDDKTIQYVVVANGSTVHAAQDVAMTLQGKGTANGTATAITNPDGTIVSDPITVPNPAGLHARPAALLANKAKTFQSGVELHMGDNKANLKSVIAIIAMEVQANSVVTLSASGSDAAQAIAELSAFIAEGSGENFESETARKVEPVLTVAPLISDDPNLLLGIPASPGLAIGTVFQIEQEAILVPEQGANPTHETTDFERAMKEAWNQLENIKKAVDAGKAEIFNAHQSLLNDVDLQNKTREGISKGQSAGFAWKAAYTAHAQTLAKLDNPIMASLADDVRDIGKRVLRILAGVHVEELEIPQDSVLIADELTPSETANLDRSKVAGFILTGGGATSHVAILARSMAIPAICAMNQKARELKNGSTVILDGEKGSLRTNPTEVQLQEVRGKQEAMRKTNEEELAHAHEPACTTDGVKVEVVANIGSVEDAKKGNEMGGEGVGLLRSEFLFLDRSTEPSEDEQSKVYEDIAKAVGQHTLVVRTLDIGGDKPLSYMPMPAEENPFLGVRGVRLCLAKPELFRTQLRAVLRAAGYTKLHIMFPMISDLDELREVKKILTEEKAALQITAEVKVGIMVEVPSTAIMADLFAKEADFFSIGTNDLTQYVLAMDRGHPQLARHADAFHPSVLRLIHSTAKGASAQGKWTGVCGGLASETLAVPLLLGMGVDEFSVTPVAIPAIKAAVRHYSKAECQQLVTEVLNMETAAQVRARVTQFIADHH